jgi:hypothetical protein
MIDAWCWRLKDGEMSGPEESEGVKVPNASLPVFAAAEQQELAGVVVY